MTTPVIFKMEDGEALAFFPTLPGSPGDATCYRHIGQHGSCPLSYGASLKPPSQVQEPMVSDLMRELVAIGYDDLEVRRKVTPAMREALRAAHRA